MKSSLIVSLSFFIVLATGENSPYYNQEPNYTFKWEVKDDYSGQDFGQEEARQGYNTDGEYSVILPDGRRQIVTYNVANAESGYIADVRYEGEGKLVGPPSAAPSYKSPLVYVPHLPAYAAPVKPSYSIPAKPSYSAVKPPVAYKPSTPKSPYSIYNFEPGPAPYVPTLVTFTPKPIFTTTQALVTQAPTTTEGPPVYRPGSAKPEKMKLSPKLKVHPNQLNLPHLFYGDLSKSKFKGDKKIHE